MTSSKINTLKDQLLKTGRRLARPDLLFWTLPYLMILIFVGTIAQKSMGLYEAQKMFFSSFWFFWYGVPLPGGYSVLAFMTLNLVCKFLFLSPWTKAKIGIHIIHLSIIILFVGGLLTAITMKEGYIALSEGQSGSSVNDYHERTMTFTNDDNQIAMSFYDLKNTTISDLPFNVKILKTCVNTAIRPRENLDANNNEGIGAASMAEMVCADPFVENERNIAGVTYRVSGADEGQNGIYIAFETRQTTDQINGYDVRLDRENRALPFSVTLNRFQRDVYPGTNMPRDYESRVTIQDGDIIWPAVIFMNEPLRYGGYTFYQASTLIDQDGQAVSVLSAVRNQGWIFPYISGILLAVGLLIHIFMRVKKT